MLSGFIISGNYTDEKDQIYIRRASMALGAVYLESFEDICTHYICENQ